MKMKYLVPAFLAFSLVSGAVLSSDASAWSHGGGSNGYHNSGGSGHNGGYGKMGIHRGYNLDGKDRVQYDAMFQKHQDKVQPLRSQLFVKIQELEALQNATNPDIEAVKKASNELVDIKQDIRQERKDFRASINKSFN